jgi:hypothetical protein
MNNDKPLWGCSMIFTLMINLKKVSMPPSLLSFQSPCQQIEKGCGEDYFEATKSICSRKANP